MKKLFSVFLILFLFGVGFANDSYDELKKIVNEFYNKGSCLIMENKNGNTVFVSKTAIVNIIVWDDGRISVKGVTTPQKSDFFSLKQYEIKLDENSNIVITPIK